MLRTVSVVVLTLNVVAYARCHDVISTKQTRDIGAAGVGTTPNLKELFVGRCWEYQQFFYPAGKKHDCHDVWNLFFEAFTFKDPCHVRSSDYTSLIEAVSETIPKDKTMLWSGTYLLVKAYTDDRRRYVAVADTLLGYMVDGAVWCGSSRQPGYNETHCPAPFSGECGFQQTIYDESFWGPVSESFAKNSYGVVSLMLNGTRRDGRPAFASDNFFSKYELPNLQKDQVSKLRVLVAHDTGVAPVETCSTGSLIRLATAVQERGIEFECVDDPNNVRHLLCVDDPNSKECHFANTRLFNFSYDDVSIKHVILRHYPTGGARSANTSLANAVALLFATIMVFVTSI